MSTETDRLDRVQRSRAKARERNRLAGIPDMNLDDRHEPAEYFSQLGFFVVLEKLGPTEPNHDWSEDGGDEADHEAYLAARLRDHQRVADWLREAEVYPIPPRDGVMIGDIRVMWSDRVPALKVWAGQQTLAKIAKQRQAALPKKVTAVLACEAPISGSSGMYKPCATTALEDGFSVDAVDMKRMTLVGMELLAVIGLESLPITVYPDGTIGYEVEESRYKFRIEKRNQYYSRWGTAERVRG